MLPRLVQIGPFTLYSFGLLVILGFGAGTYLAARLARERGLPGDSFIDGAVIMLFSAIAGARLLFVALNWKTFSQHMLDIAATWQGGMSFHGGIIAGVLAGVIYFRWKKIPLLPMADAAAPGLALGYAIGRIGCFLNGCCYGGETSLPWGIPGAYCLGSPNPAAHYHPAQIYATIINLGLCVGLVHLYRRPHRAGQVMALYVAAYSAYRFGIEALRKGVTADLWAFGLTQAQAFSLITLAGGLLWWHWLRSHAAPAPEPDLAPEATPAEPALSR